MKIFGIVVMTSKRRLPGTKTAFDRDALRAAHEREMQDEGEV